MRRAERRTVVVRAALLLVTGAASLSTPARAANGPCFDSYVAAQRLRKEGKLVEARDQLSTCSQSSCPAFLRNDCTQWIGEVDSSIPTVVFVAKDDHDHDLAAASVYVDDRKIADSIDGRSTSLDPGPHTVRFVFAGQASEQKVVVVAGEKDRRIEAEFTATSRGSPPVGGVLPAPEAATRRGIPVATLVLGSVAAAGLVSFVTFAVAGRVEQGCAPNCTQSEVDTLRRDYLIADVSWISGLVALTTGVAIWVFRPSSPVAAARAAPLGFAWTPVVEPARTGATLGVGGTF